MLRRALKILGTLLVASFFGLLIHAWQPMGKNATGERLRRMEKSVAWQNNHFENPQPLKNDMVGAMAAMFKASKFVAPEGEPPVAHPDAKSFDTDPPSGLRVTWFGHSATLVEIEGFRILTDPVFSERTSPVSFLGPRRWYAPPVALDDLPVIDAVVISHDHYDHLDMRTIIAMRSWKSIFIVPLGIGANLAYWGIPEERIVELDWWQEKSLTQGAKVLRVVLTPARHASGRMGFDYGKKLWGGFALIGQKKRLYYSGDTGLFPAMKDIGRRLGPFDLTMIEVGQYHRTWPDWHIGPEQAVKAHLWVHGRTLLPVHWGLFVLAAHGWTEPIERVSKEAQRLKVAIATPKPGQSFEPGVFISERWWPQVEWQTAVEHPIISSQVGPDNLR